MFLQLGYGANDKGCYARFNTPAAANANTMSGKNFGALAGTVYIMNTNLFDFLGAPALGAAPPYGAAIGPPPAGGANRRLPVHDLYFDSNGCKRLPWACLKYIFWLGHGRQLCWIT